MNLASLPEGAWEFAKVALALATSIAPIVIAVFTLLTWLVYRQIKGVMKDSFESEFRPVVHAKAKISSTPRRSSQWNVHLRLKNVGTGVAHRVRLRTRNPTNDQPGEWSDPDKDVGDLMPGEESITRTQSIDDNVPRFDISYFDLYGNEFMTELRGKLLRYARVDRASDPGTEK